MNRCFVRLAGSVVLWCITGWGADWNQWRGPGRVGVAVDSPSLLSEWPTQGLRQLWESEPIKGGGGGYGCVSVAGDRAYVLECRKYKETLTTRTLSGDALKKLGWFEEKPSGETLDAIEAARIGEERAKVDNKELSKWITGWISANIKADERKKVGPFASDRLKRGAKALPLEALDKIAEIKDREFPGVEEFETWLNESGIGAAKDAVVKAVPTFEEKANDAVLCLDANTGKTLWKAVCPGRPEPRKSCSTPCVTGNKCFVAGSGGTIYCLNATDGSVVWRASPGNAQGVNSSPVVADDKVILLAGVLTAFDLESGEVKWKQDQVKGTDNSPSAWEHGGKQYVVCNAGKQVFCVSAEDGKVIWKARGGGLSSAAVAGEYLLVQTDQKDGLGLICYQVSGSEAKELWKAPVKEGHTSPVIDGEYAYSTGETNAICVELKSGKVLWKTDIKCSQCSSPALADGKLITQEKGGLIVAQVSPEACLVLGRMKCKIMEYGSPVVSGGKLYLRMAGAVACYEIGSAKTGPE